ncbi:MAG: UDP-N-acetylmuramate:L-alanyl-gamma-D-glutamyl-meso-diaminopimelate ligase [Myxococcales bacterium]|nr:MAG: UDP-N-acetylmuramate:L-alanyl-gamma-D-glutamyl-meso-diaminopimelate ligase [Myxococcales bacterium]
MHIHFVGVAGTGMGPLAGLLRSQGHRITGSDTAFYPPIGPALEAWDIEILEGYDERHLEPAADLIVVGNVCRKDNLEASAALENGLNVISMPEAIETLILHKRPSYVVSGTHGKTTTTALLAFLLQRNSVEPGYLIGGAPLNFKTSFSLGNPTHPFVIEGDEYDSAFFEKTPKFWRYRPSAAILTSIEYDHIDIYPSQEHYEQAFVEFVKRIPKDGLLVANAADAAVCRIATQAPCKVIFVGVEETGAFHHKPNWRIRAVSASKQGQHFSLVNPEQRTINGISPLYGKHNLLNTLSAFALCRHQHDIKEENLLDAMSEFRGVKRRQEMIAEHADIRVYDDFAHHPTAVSETLWAIRHKHPEGKLVAVFEPRSATSCRKLHQHVYPKAFALADRVLLAPVGRKNIAQEDQLDTQDIALHIGEHATACSSIDEILSTLVTELKPHDTVVLMSNGSFEKLGPRLSTALSKR